MSLPTFDIQSSAVTAVQTLRTHLSQALSVRISNLPVPPSGSDPKEARIAVLFSGGLDCTVLARLAADILPPDQVVDLINVAFENPRVAAQLQATSGGQTPNIYEACPDRITGRLAFRELKSVCPDRLWRFIAVREPFLDFTDVLHNPQTRPRRFQAAPTIYFSNTFS
jgi:asparagine synthetase B (glutamine-hydrolysing)